MKFGLPRSILRNLNKTQTLFAGIVIGAGFKELLESCFNSSAERENVLSSDLLPSSFATSIENTVGLPLPSKIIPYSKHVLYYDNAKKIPSYVLEKLSKENLIGTSDRSNCHFKPDRYISERFRATNEDYFGSGYARGHMVPAGDVKSDQDGMQETFYLSNIVPQDFENNAGFWYRFECYCRSLAKKYTNVYVISGPVFVPEKSEDNRKYIKYEVIGAQEVAVPSHLYKVILVELPNKSYARGAFIIPNRPVKSEKKLKDFQVDLEILEKYSGFHFFPKLSRNEITELCIHDECKVISKETADFYHLSRSIKKAKSLPDLEKIWKKADDLKMTHDKRFQDEFWEKKLILKNQV